MAININQMIINPKASWTSKGKDQGDIWMGTLLQNCDLPPPMKVFSGSNNTVVSSMNRVFSRVGIEGNDGNQYGVYRGGDVDGDCEKLELLKAVRLSQTRAREAEKRAACLVRERDCLGYELLKESLQVLACRRWVRLLEAQVLKLTEELQKQNNELKKGNDYEHGMSWISASAFFLGIAGVGVGLALCLYIR